MHLAASRRDPKEVRRGYLYRKDVHFIVCSRSFKTHYRNRIIFLFFYIGIQSEHISRISNNQMREWNQAEGSDRRARGKSRQSEVP